MKLTATLAILLGAIAVSVVLSQQPPAAQRTGPGVQAPQDAKYAGPDQDLQDSASGPEAAAQKAEQPRGKVRLLRRQPPKK